MKITLVAVGRLRAGPERDLVDDYLSRFAKTGRAVGLPSITVQEVEGKGPVTEADAIARTLPAGCAIIALDERGIQLSSRDFAQKLGLWRDRAQDVAFVIGGADGLDQALRDRADFLLSFGPMVWPHMLARVMLSEQLYRAASILAGAPYHRD